MNNLIPDNYNIKTPINHDTFLINGKIGYWKGESTNVISTLLSKNENDDHLIIGTTPKMDEKHALEALEAAHNAFSNGTGTWPTMKVYERINCMENFVNKTFNNKCLYSLVFIAHENQS